MRARGGAAAGAETGLSPFVGRRDELARLRLQLDANRLVTITGAGGVGKTRLALETARRGQRLAQNEAWFVDLARLQNPRLVAAAIADTIRAPRIAGATHLDRAAEHIGDGARLLVLDNCEHVTKAAAGACTALLSRCARLRVLATSREPLGVPGEQMWPAPPLDVPDADASAVADISAADAVQLFVGRASAVAPGFALTPAHARAVAGICRRLDGVPLAIELAAAWVAFLSPEEIASRLEGSSVLRRSRRGAGGRHVSMQAALDWSHRMLAPAERCALARLSVFVGGFALEGAEDVLDSAADSMSALDAVVALAERSLLVADTSTSPARYRMLEPVREYAADRLHNDSSEEAEARRRHLAHFVRLARESADSLLIGPDIPWLRRFDDELPNIRAALTWGFDDGDAGAAELSVSLIWFCYARALYDEGREWAGRAMAMSDGRMFGRAAHMAGNLAAQVGEPGEGDRLLALARDVLARTESWRDLVMVLFDQCVVAYHRGDFDTMRIHGDEAVALARRLQDDALEMTTLWYPAVMAERDGDPATACEHWRRAIAMAGRRECEFLRALSLLGLADTLLDMGDYEAALATIRERLDASAVLENAPMSDASVIETTGMLAIQAGDEATGLRLIAAARAARERTRFRRTDAEEERVQRWISEARRALRASSADAAWAAGTAMPVGQAVIEAREFSTAAAQPGRHRALRTFMFTDIVGSTELLHAIGDSAWHELLEWHNRTLRDAFTRHGGEEVDSAGDGFFVAFPDPGEAVECAIEIQRTLADHRRVNGFAPTLRIGLHASEAVHAGDRYRGAAVHLAARIGAHAAGGEILLSDDTALHLGSRYPLSSPRAVSLKGLPHDVSVVTVGWR
jgi:predicted ATPase/class 3 adenylate cyclase